MDALRQQLGDRSRLEDDQGAFLDAVLLAQEQLWLFYNGFDINDGEVREPSSVLQGFRDHLALIVQSSPVPRYERGESEEVPMFIKEGLGEICPPQLYPLYHVHQFATF